MSVEILLTAAHLYKKVKYISEGLQ